MGECKIRKLTESGKRWVWCEAHNVSWPALNGRDVCPVAEVATLRQQLAQARELLSAVQPHMECFRDGITAPNPDCLNGPGNGPPCSTCLMADEVERFLSAAHPETREEPQT